MMKLTLIIRRDCVFYPLLFIAWAVLIYCVNARYSYFGMPFPGVDLGARQSSAAAEKAMTDSIAELRYSLLSGKSPARTLESIGTIFYRLYTFTKKRAYLDSAKPCFEKALDIDSSFPTLHYLLGELALEKHDAAAAMGHFENELRIFNALSASHKSPFVDPSDIRMAACFSSLKLAFLYSTSFIDAQKAQDRFNTYMKLETDPGRRRASINEIQKYWKTNQVQDGFK